MYVDRERRIQDIHRAYLALFTDGATDKVQTCLAGTRSDEAPGAKFACGRGVS